MAIFKGFIQSRLPARHQIHPVFSVIIFCVFTWALYRMFFQLQSWLFDMSLWNAFVLVAYVLAYSLFESLVMLAFILFLSLLFPARVFKDKFESIGSAVVLVISTGAYLLQRKIGLLDKVEPQRLAIYTLATPIAIALVVLVLHLVMERFKITAHLFGALADRMTVFAYLYIPLGLISLAIVLVRNII